jgi:hypothetical protein
MPLWLQHRGKFSKAQWLLDFGLRSGDVMIKPILQLGDPLLRKESLHMQDFNWDRARFQ